MGSQLPYRLPCGSTTATRSRCCGGETSVLVDKYTNTTMVTNWDTSVGAPPTIPPYERWSADSSAPESCEVHYSGNGGPYGAGWPLPYPANTFSHTPGDQVNFAVANKKGFKNVQAARNWNGRYGYLDLEASNGNDTWIPCDSGTSVITYRSAQSAALQTRYTQLEITSTWHWLHNSWDGPPATTPATTRTEDQSASVTQVINSAGILNTTALSLIPNSSQTEPLDDFPQKAFAALQKGFKHLADVENDIISGTIDLSGGGTQVWTATTLTRTNSYQIETITWDIAGGTFNRTIQQNFPDAGGYLNILVEQYTLTETGLAYQKDEYNRIGDPGPSQGMIVDHKTTTVTGTLSGAVTFASLYADIVTLLAQWDLTNDKQYPWRTDLKTSLAPRVTRDELLTQDFDPLNFYVRDYGAPVTDPFGRTIGNPDWGGDTGYTINPNPQTGTYRTAIDFAGHNSGVTVDLQVTPNFTQTNAAITYTVIGGSFPPGVSMDSSGHITGTVGDDGHYGVTIEATCGVPAATGAIRGAPNPAGYQNYFDFAFNDIRGCCYRPSGPPGPGFTAWDWYPVGWGQDLVTFNGNSSASIPLNATQWTNWPCGVNKPNGAWIFFSDRADYFPGDCLPSTVGAHSTAYDAGQLVAQKWAEILEPWNSQNFARPGGADKFLWDESKVYCISSISGSGEGATGTLANPLDGSTPPDDIDTTGYWGGPSVGGFYAIASYSGGTVTLGAKQYDVPTGFASLSNGDESTAFGKMRYPTAPALLGRAAVTTIGPGTSFTFTTAQPYFGMLSATHHESIDLYDSSMTLLASSVTATRVNDTHFTIASGQPTAVYVQIHGSPKWYMNDSDTKGDYVELEWLADFRSAGEYGRITGVVDCGGTQVSRPSANQGGGDVQNLYQSFSQTACCIGFNPCGPRVVCISPNGETFPNGRTYAFPTTFTADEQYGSKWWGYVQQTMTDLLWQRPHRPCNIETCSRWLMDDSTCHDNAVGSCPGDVGYVEGESTPPVYYYGFTPLVEARISIPSAADCSKAYGPTQDESPPSVPSDVQIGWLSPVTHAYGEANVAFPPPPPGIESDTGRPGNAITPWNIHALLCASAAGGCRFNYSPPGC